MFRLRFHGGANDGLRRDMEQLPPEDMILPVPKRLDLLRQYGDEIPELPRTEQYRAISRTWTVNSTGQVVNIIDYYLTTGAVEVLGMTYGVTHELAYTQPEVTFHSLHLMLERVLRNIDAEGKMIVPASIFLVAEEDFLRDVTIFKMYGKCQAGHETRMQRLERKRKELESGYSG